MNNVVKRHNNTFIQLLIIVVAITIVFGASLMERIPHLGDLTANDSRLTFDTSNFIYNWLQEGIFNINGKLYKIPASIETPNCAQEYSSYPPGFMIVPYILCLVTGDSASVSLIQSWNLVNHWMLSCILGLIIYFIYKKSGFKSGWFAVVIASLAGITTIFIPGLYYYMQFEYFADTAGLVPIAALILTEILIDENEGKLKKVLYWIQVFFIFAAAFTDFIAYIVIFAIWMVRIFKRQYKSIKEFIIGTLKYVWPMLLAIALFGLYLFWSVDGVSPFLSRYAQRSSFPININWVKKIGYWMLSLMGLRLLILITVSSLCYALLTIIGLVFNIKNKAYKNLMGWGAISFLPMIVINFALSEHAYHHDFTMLKFSVPLIILSFAVSPILLYMAINKLIKTDKARRIFKRIVAALIIMCAVMICLISFLDRNLYYEPRLGYKFDFGPQKFVYEMAEYEDFVYVTPEQLDIAYPPVYSRKMIHSLYNMDVIYERVERLDDAANICILYVKNPVKPLSETYEVIFSIMDSMKLIYQDSDYEFYRCSKAEFLEILEELNLAQ